MFMNKIESIKSSKLGKNMKKNNLVVNQKNALPLINDMVKQMSIIEDSLNQINNILNKVVYKKIVDGKDIDNFLNIGTKCSTTAGNYNKLSTNTEMKFNDSLKKFQIKELNERISSLEDKISILYNE